MSSSLWPHGLGACQAPLFMEFSRQEYWSRLPFHAPGALPNSGFKRRSPTLQVDSLLSEPPGKPTTSWLESNSLIHCPHGHKNNLSKLRVWTSYPSVKYPLGFLIALEVKFKFKLFVRFSRSLLSSPVSSLIIHHLIIYALAGQNYLKFLRLSPQNSWNRIWILTWSLDESPTH